MSELKIRNSGAWAAPTNIKVKSGGSWTQVSSLYVKQDGTWYTAWAPPPDAPVLTVTNTNAYVNATSWTQPSSILTITSYTLQRSTDNATWTTIYTGLTRSFNDTGLTQSTTYYYRVAARNLYVFGGYSTTVNRTTRTATLKRSTFNSSGTFSKPIGVTSVTALVVGGGGSAYGAYWEFTDNFRTTAYGGGIGGQVKEQAVSFASSASSVSVTVAAAAASSFSGSSIFSTVTSTGGGNNNNYATWEDSGSFEISGRAYGFDSGVGGRYKYVGGYGGYANGGAGTTGAISSQGGYPGVTSSISGSAAVYGSGGNGTENFVDGFGTFISSTNGGVSSNPAANTGNGGHSPVADSLPGGSITPPTGAGASGIVIVVWYD